MTDRQLKIVEEYRAGDTLEIIGQRQGITRERVRQIVARYEEENDIKFARKYRTLERERWHCEVCGAERIGTPTELSKLPTRCSRCRSVDPEQIARFVAEYKEYGSWLKVTILHGHPPTSANIPRKVYLHLLTVNDAATIRELWPDGIPRWMAAKHGLPENIHVASRMTLSPKERERRSRAFQPT